MTQPNEPVSQRAEACAKALFEFDNEGCTWEEWLDYAEQHRTFQGMVTRYREKGSAIAETLASTTSQSDVIEKCKEALGAASDWDTKIAELWNWTGSKFLAGEKQSKKRADLDRSQLYGWLCGLGGYLMAAREAACKSEGNGNA